METKAKNLNCLLHIKRLSLGQISEFVRLRKDSYCNVKLERPDSGQHTVHLSLQEGGVNVLVPYGHLLV